MRSCPLLRVSPTPPKPLHVAGVAAVAPRPPRAMHRKLLPSISEAVKSENATPRNRTTQNARPQRVRAQPRTVGLTPPCNPGRPNRPPPPLRPPNRHRGRPNDAGRRAGLPPPARMQHPVASGPAASARRGSGRFRTCRVQSYHQKHNNHTESHKKAGFVSKVCWCPRFTHPSRNPGTSVL